jgi:ornithine cyclodeaminase
MVPFVDVESLARWARDTGPGAIFGGMVAYLEDDFRRWPVFDKIPRVGSQSEFGVVELMPTSDGLMYGFKYVNCHPVNTKVGRQTVNAFGALADMANGYPIFLTEMTLLTAFRTASTSAMVAKYLARPDSSAMALIGTGAQSEFQALAFREVHDINRLRIWDIDPAAMDKLTANLEPLGFEVYRATDASDAVAGADIVTTCTADKANATVLHDADIEPGMHLNAIGGDCPGKTELDAAILGRAEVFVEFAEQTRTEGEIQQLPADFPVTELWQVVAGDRPGRTSTDQITVFDSVGFAIEDFSALRFLRDRTVDTDYVTPIGLVAEPEDCKNLFGLIAEPTGER